MGHRELCLQSLQGRGSSLHEQLEMRGVQGPHSPGTGRGRPVSWRGLAWGRGSPAQAAALLAKAVGPADEHGEHRELVIDLLRGTGHTHESHSPEALRKRRKVSKGFAGP